MTGQVFYHYRQWEDWVHGMWNDPRDLSHDTRHAAAILTDPDLFDEAARLMLADWPNAAQQNLTNPRRTGRSWLGQATCCWLANLSETATRTAWWLLSPEDRQVANTVADEVVAHWRRTRAIDLTETHRA